MYYVLIILGVLLALLIILSLIAPKSYHVSRSIELDHPTEKVWGHLKYWRNWIIIGVK